MHKLSFGGGIVKLNQLCTKDCLQPRASTNSFSTEKNTGARRKPKGNKKESGGIRFFQQSPQHY